jgi:outer membrane protein assembly factor BamD (BamD/ComL family)
VSPPDPRVIIVPAVATLAVEHPTLDEPTLFFSAFEEAEQRFADGNYEDARNFYEAALNDERYKDQRDLILFKLGLTYLLPTSSRGNWQAAAERFKRLDEQYPKSPFRTAAEMILALHTDLEHTTGDKRQMEQKFNKLNTELEALKQIDALGRRRRP